MSRSRKHKRHAFGSLHGRTQSLTSPQAQKIEQILHDQDKESQPPESEHRHRHRWRPLRYSDDRTMVVVICKGSHCGEYRVILRSDV